jgi:hypothetical protein
VHDGTRARSRWRSEIGAAPENLSSGSPNCTGDRHQGTPGTRERCTNYGLIPREFQPSRTVTRDAARSPEFADGFVDLFVARFLN